MAFQSATATFAATSTPQTVTWPAFMGNFGTAWGLTVTDGGGPPDIWLTAVSSSGATVNTSASFSGSVNLLIYDQP